MEKKGNPAASLSQEELLVILRYLGVSHLPGIDENLLSELTEEQAQVALATAERALVARNFLLLNRAEHKLELLTPVAALVGACAKPDFTLIMTLNYLDRPSELLLFHGAREVFVSHIMPISGIHQFTMLEDKRAIGRAVLTSLALEEKAAPATTPVMLPQSVIGEARQVAEEDGVDAVLTLLRASVPQDARVNVLANSFSTLSVNATLVYLYDQQDEQPKDAGFTVLQGENGSWLLRPVADSDDMVQFTPVSTDELRASIRDLLGTGEVPA